jgi:septal ring factor EnvC (AmiA/AmiB activator)
MSENVSELLAEIERLRARVAELEAERASFFVELRDADTDISDLRALNDKLEAALAMRRGSLAPHPADDEPGNYTHDVKPNAPR